jgi:hypothetical protein
MNPERPAPPDRPLALFLRQVPEEEEDDEDDEGDGEDDEEDDEDEDSGDGYSE